MLNAGASGIAKKCSCGCRRDKFFYVYAQLLQYISLSLVEDRSE